MVLTPLQMKRLKANNRPLLIGRNSVTTMESLALTNVTLIDGTGAPAQFDQAVIVEKGVIDWLGPMSALPSFGPDIDEIGRAHV